MKRFWILGLVVSAFVYLSSCEVDDICTEKVLTPRLIVKFYNDTVHTKVRSISGLTVWAKDQDTLYANKSADSILLPLNTFADVTQYCLSVNDTIDTLTVHYDRKNVFVSRSCGYKTLFTLTQETLTSHKFTGFETVNNPQTIENETHAHIKIYH